jgi:hypothetical protein
MRIGGTGSTRESQPSTVRGAAPKGAMALPRGARMTDARGQATMAATTALTATTVTTVLTALTASRTSGAEVGVPTPSGSGTGLSSRGDTGIAEAAGPTGTASLAATVTPEVHVRARTRVTGGSRGAMQGCRATGRPRPPVGQRVRGLASSRRRVKARGHRSTMRAGRVTEGGTAGAGGGAGAVEAGDVMMTAVRG